MVDLATVPLAAGPMLVTLLEDAGITVTAIESYNIVTSTRSHLRIMVRRDEFAAATEIIEQAR